MSETRNFMALDWVKTEIEDTLRVAREALEAFAETPDDTTLARQCLSGLHQVNGTLQMVELNGAATLATEMESLAQALMNRSVTAEEAAQEALMEGILQLPAHLNRVHRGAEDDPRLFALLVDRMRVARGETPLTAREDLEVDPDDVAAFVAGKGPAEVRKVRAGFQKAMLALIRKAQPPQKLYPYFDRVFTRLAQLTPASPLRRVWSLAAGVMELRAVSGEEPGPVLPLLRALDTELKELAETPDAALVSDPPEKLVDGLTAIVEAPSDHDSERLTALRRSLIPTGEPVEAMTVGADDETIATVARALHEELGSIRDRLDLFVRGSVSDLEGLAALGRDLHRIAGTLAVVGLDDLRSTIATQAAWIRQQVEAEKLDDDAIMEVASAVLFVDSTLMSLAGIESDDADGMPGSLSDAHSAVLREARTSLENVKQAIVDFIASDWDHTHLSDVPGTLTMVKSVLVMVPLERAAALVEACRDYVQKDLLAEGTVPEWQRLDSLADAITSIDYFLERMLEDRVIPDPRLLEIAEESIAELGAPIPEAPSAPDLNATQVREAASILAEDDAAGDGEADPAPAAEAAPEPTPSDDAAGEMDLAPAPESESEPAPAPAPAPDESPAAPDLDAAAAAGEDAPSGLSAPAEDDFDLGLDDAEGVDAEPPPAPDATPEPAEPASAEAAAGADDADDDLVDDEIIEIFLEEVVEVLESIDAALPAWKANPSDSDSLSEVRRAFHTLKGSGRMVGAGTIGELAWSVENMLNRVIDGTIDASAAVIDLAERVRNLTPTLREDFAARREATVDVAPLMERADVLASGGTPDEMDDLPDAPGAEAPASEAAPAASAEDDLDGAGADAPSGLSSPAEEDFDLGPDDDAGESIDLAATPEPEAAPETPAAASAGEDAPSGLSAPAEEDFDLDLGLDDDAGESIDLAATPEPEAPEPEPEPEPEPAPEPPAATTTAGEDAPSGLSAPAEDDFDLGDDFDLNEDAPPAVDADDGGLLDIFEEEAGEHLDTVRAYLSASRKAGIPRPLDDELRRALHTLKGSAAMAGFPGLAEIAAPLEHLVRAHLELSRPADEPLLSLLERGVELFDSGLTHLRQTGSEKVEDTAERTFVEAARARLAERNAEIGGRDGPAPQVTSAIFRSDAIDLLLEAQTIVGAWAEGRAEDRLEALRSELGEVAERARGAGQSRIAELAAALQRAHRTLGRRLPSEVRPLLDRGHEALVGMLDNLAAGLDVPDASADVAELTTVAETPTAPAPSAAPAGGGGLSESVAALDLDPEMVEIFFEEADEIGESIEGALDQWTRGDDAGAAELMRALHTLKGGARMAGLTGLGGEAHDLETWIGERRGSADDAFFDELRERADAVAEHVAALRRGETVTYGAPASAELVAESAPPATEAPPAPEPSAPEPAETPEPEAAAEPAPAGAAVDDLSDTDPEILDLFLEEANELTEELDGAIGAWRDAPDNEIHLEALLRALHTLKGGARMANLMALGEAAHDLETRLIDRRGSDVDAAFLAGVQQEVDAISARVAAIAAGGTDAAAPEAPAPEPSAPEPVAEPAAPTPEPEPVAPQPAEDRPAPEAAAPPPMAEPRGDRDAPVKESAQEMIRVSSDLLEHLVTLAGETSIMRGRVQQEVSDFGAALDEMSSTLERMREQVRRLDSEAQEQVHSRQEAQERAEKEGYEDFDPLEMDRYTQLQEFARTLNESATDVQDLRDTLVERLRTTDTLLVQQGRINTELQEGLMRTRMVPFARLLPRLKRIVRQVGRELGKPVDLKVENAEGELDRNVLERMIPPLEHMLRNAVDHGLEKTEVRTERGKPPQGTITLRLDRDGGDILIEVADDGGGINADGVKAKAIERGLLAPDAAPGQEEILAFIMSAGFSTAQSVTQISGRGVGMDVVASEVKQLGGSISIASTLGAGTTFTVRLPFTVSVNRALMVHVGDDRYAVPLEGIEGIVRVSPLQLKRKYAQNATNFAYAGRTYSLSYLGEWFGLERQVKDDVPSVPILMVRSGDSARAVHVDSVTGSREIVVKTLGPQFSSVAGVTGATILGDGSVVVILDLPAMLRGAATMTLEGTASEPKQPAEPRAERQRKLHVMVVDDSVTVRKVTTRLLERKGYAVSVAKDGVEAVAALSETTPDVMLLDIEMPRMDGFEVATHVRNEAALKDVPIIMITSRTGDKHRERAEAIGVNRFLGKPFQEAELLETIGELTGP
jgi:chemosensory pili system protein ChpA (sensor histidine kinase/response regulator)